MSFSTDLVSLGMYYIFFSPFLMQNMWCCTSSTDLFEDTLYLPLSLGNDIEIERRENEKAQAANRIRTHALFIARLYRYKQYFHNICVQTYSS